MNKKKSICNDSPVLKIQKRKNLADTFLCSELFYPNSFFVLWIYTDRTRPTQIYSIMTELPPAE